MGWQKYQLDNSILLLIGICGIEEWLMIAVKRNVDDDPFRVIMTRIS